MEDESEGFLGTRERQRWESSEHWAYPTPNGCYDPLTYLFILDTIMNIDADIELRAGKLADYLATMDYRMTWDAVTVGKVLSDLCDAFEDVLGVKSGLLERGRDWKGAFYRLHRNPTTARRAQMLRKDLYYLAKTEMDVRNKGGRSPGLASPLLECASVREEWRDI
jgi:hypothetical protein